MTTLLHTHDGVSPVHEIVEQQMDEQATQDKAIRWEALREQCMTIGAKDALDRACRGHVLFDYLWFLLVTAMVMLALAKWARDPDLIKWDAGDVIPEHVTGGRGDGLR